MSTSATTATFVRPNGKEYRPRTNGLVAQAWSGFDEDGVIIFGTLNPTVAQEFADRMCRYWYGCERAVCPEPGWFRKGFHHGDPAWVVDETRGRPAVNFTAESD
ncbi:hypothetical protein [Mycobacteroides abscessus]|uniref:hypothetical protein n=1 Tax=Mycobacteroides abscessus TaxID=36809 RepID=UPI0013000507|nr:hypothetical protein [Mycobacteroides abscessus]